MRGIAASQAAQTSAPPERAAHSTQRCGSAMRSAAMAYAPADIGCAGEATAQQAVKSLSARI
jgi:hypothetical protein